MEQTGCDICHKDALIERLFQHFTCDVEKDAM
jgi:hypothetical protein